MDVASEGHRLLINSESVATPLWFLRLTNTRLVDSIMEICAVPQKDSARKACLQIFARVTAPAPGLLAEVVARPQRKRSSTVSQLLAPKGVERPDPLKHIDVAVESGALPKNTGTRLKLLLMAGCSPLPPNIDDALDAVLLATGKLRTLDAENQVADPRRLKRYEDIARTVKTTKHLVQSMKTIGIGPVLGSKNKPRHDFPSRPLYIALDLGLRQKRKHFHGHLFFQAIVLPDQFFDATNGDASDEYSSKKSASIVWHGTKVAEGGRYDELVSSRSFFH